MFLNKSFLAEILYDRSKITYLHKTLYKLKTYLHYRNTYDQPTTYLDYEIPMTYLEELLHIKLLDPLCSLDLARSHDKLKSIYLHYHIVYGHQRWQDSDLTRWAITNNVAFAFDYIFLWARSRDNLKAIYLHYHNTYGQ